MDRVVRLEQVWRWKCPECGTVNLSDYVAMPRDEADEMIREQNGLEPWESIPEELQGNFIASPEIVTCSSCSNGFGAIVEEPEDEDVDPATDAPPSW